MNLIKFQFQGLGINIATSNEGLNHFGRGQYHKDKELPRRSGGLLILILK